MANQRGCRAAARAAPALTATVPVTQAGTPNTAEPATAAVGHAVSARRNEHAGALGTDVQQTG
jgi:hypothetical protein